MMKAIGILLFLVGLASGQCVDDIKKMPPAEAAKVLVEKLGTKPEHKDEVLKLIEKGLTMARAGYTGPKTLKEQGFKVTDSYDAKFKAYKESYAAAEKLSNELYWKVYWRLYSPLHVIDHRYTLDSDRSSNSPYKVYLEKTLEATDRLLDGKKVGFYWEARNFLMTVNYEIDFLTKNAYELNQT